MYLKTAIISSFQTLDDSKSKNIPKCSTQTGLVNFNEQMRCINLLAYLTA